MTGLAAALWTEALKARRSRMPWLTVPAFSLAPVVGGLFMLILEEPEWARRAGMATPKARLAAGAADWPTYFGLLAQATAVGGFVLFGLIAIWVFGREYGDRTIIDLLAVPTSRAAIVGAKFVVVALWSAALVGLVYGLGLCVGAAIGLSGWSPALAAGAGARIAATAGLTVALVTPLPWAASAGRGYLPAVGLMFLLLVLSQIVAALGWGAWFPWSAPALSSGVAGPEAARLGLGSYLLVAGAGLAGVTGTLAWWRFADQS